MEAETTDATSAYSYRPSLFGASYEFRLASDALEWEFGRRSGRVPYKAIRRVRISFRPVALQSHRFLTEIWSDTPPTLKLASTSLRGMMEVERHDAAYSAFVAELHRRIAAAGGTPVLESGNNPVLYWTAVVLFAAVAIGLAALTVRGLQESLIGAAFVAAFLGFFLWQMGNFLRRNRPRRYAPDALPPDLLPG